MSDAISDPPIRSRPILFLFILAPLLGAVIGTITNLINGQISAEYYGIVLDCPMELVSPMLIIHGVIEGGAVGLLFALVFVVSAAFTTGLRSTRREVLRALCACIVLVLAGWLVGGMGGMIWAATNPKSFVSLFDLSSSATSIPAFAWVGGSIWGEEIGAVVVAIVIPILLRHRSRSMNQLAGFAIDTK